MRTLLPGNPTPLSLSAPTTSEIEPCESVGYDAPPLTQQTVFLKEPQMLKRFLVAVPRIACTMLLVPALNATAAEIKLASASGMRSAMSDLLPQFERESGHTVAVTFAAPGPLSKNILSGEIVDVVVAPEATVDGLLKNGKAMAGNVTVFARSGIAVAVRKGLLKPDISSPDALRRVLLAARSITYSNPASGGASGIHFAKVLDRLGIADEMRPRTVFSLTTGTVGELVANGEAEIAVQQFQELASVPGIEVIGPLPGDLQSTIVFSAVIMNTARNVSAARSLVEFLRSKEAAALFRTKGIEPATP